MHCELGKEARKGVWKTNNQQHGRRRMKSAHIPNSKFFKEATKEKYGEIKHPVIGDIPRCILKYFADTGTPEH
jgi:hypothetical protein